jgi:hypothetical protein
MKIEVPVKSRGLVVDRIDDHGDDGDPRGLDIGSMQRVMICVVVNPKKFPKTNIAGATALEQYLRAPQTQTLIHGFRIPGIAQPVFYRLVVTTKTRSWNLGLQHVSARK